MNEEQLLNLLYTRFPKGVLTKAYIGYYFSKNGEDTPKKSITSGSLYGILEVALKEDAGEDG